MRRVIYVVASAATFAAALGTYDWAPTATVYFALAALAFMAAAIAAALQERK